MKILNIYGQYDNHTEAKIVGNRKGLQALQRALYRALNGDNSTTGEEREPLYASDGEGYEVKVEMYNDLWGIDKKTGKEDPNSFWTKPESNPQYLMKEIMRAKDEELEPVDALHGWYYDWLKFEKVEVK